MTSTVKQTIGFYSPNGGNESTHWATPRKFTPPEGNGFARDLALHASNRKMMDFGFSTWHNHGPHGWADPYAMELPSWPRVKQLLLDGDKRFEHLANLQEFVTSHVMLYELSVWLGRPFEFVEIYVGRPEHDQLLVTAFAKKSSAWASRVDSSLKPATELAKRGVPVRVIVDMAGRGLKDSLSHRVVMRCIERHKLSTGVEPNIGIGSEWANHADIPIFCPETQWDRNDPAVFEDATDAIPHADLKGEKIVFVTEHVRPRHHKTNTKVQTPTQRAMEFLAEGCSVRLNTVPEGFNSAAEMAAALMKGGETK